MSQDPQIKQATAKMIARQTMHAMITEAVRAEFDFEHVIQGVMEGVREWVMTHAQEDFDATAGVLQRASTTLLRMPDVG